MSIFDLMDTGFSEFLKRRMVKRRRQSHRPAVELPGMPSLIPDAILPQKRPMPFSVCATNKRPCVETNEVDSPVTSTNPVGGVTSHTEILSPIPQTRQSDDHQTRSSLSDVSSESTEKATLSRSCEKCREEFATDADLIRHYSEHHLFERPFRCKQCDKTFGQRSTLSTHERTVHGGQRLYSCDRCPSSFGQVGDLNRHKKTVHEKMRPHACEYCPQKFGIRSQLKKHVSTVHRKEKPFACPECPWKFGEKATLKKHLRAKHPSVRL